MAKKHTHKTACTQDHAHAQDRTHTMPIKSIRAPAHTHTQLKRTCAGAGGEGGEVKTQPGVVELRQL